MKIAIVGCGAMGSVYAGRMSQAGHDVLVVDRWQQHVDQINQHGLRLTGSGASTVSYVRAFSAPPHETVDVIVLAVKAAQAASAALGAAPLMGAATVVVTIQNGIGAADEVADAIGGDRLVVGIASGFGAALRSPGDVTFEATRAVRFGSYGILERAEVDDLSALWTGAGFDAAAVEDISAMQWEKLICNVAYSAPCALTGLTVGEVMDDEEMGPVSRSAATEAWGVAKALGIAIDVPDPVAHVRAFGARMPAARPSALLDIEARRVSEIAVINGAVPREAAKIGRSAPVNATLTALVLNREAGFGGGTAR